jgi:hypothetical protein
MARLHQRARGLNHESTVSDLNRLRVGSGHPFAQVPHPANIADLRA